MACATDSVGDDDTSGRHPPDERERERLRIIGRLGAHVAHSRHAGDVMTGPARRAFLARFEREVDPDNELEPAERARRAEHAKSAYFSRLAMKRGAA